MASMTGLDIEIEAKSFPAVGGAPARRVFAGFRLAVAPGSFTAILGPSGTGKTTLLNLVAGLDRDYAGHIRATAAGPRDATLPAGEALPRMAYVFQTPRLLPWRTVRENVRLALDADAVGRGLAEHFIERVGLADAADLHPERLSLGMQRRAALARAFATEPDLLLMDEPFVSLDGANAERLRHLLLDLLAARPATVLFVTHDTRETVSVADRIVELEGSPAVVVRDRENPLPLAQRRDPAAVERAHAALFPHGAVPAVAPAAAAAAIATPRPEIRA
jgi:ABC-type nitrate/sulfonate/bicarbonate transport system ATPase subunit